MNRARWFNLIQKLSHLIFLLIVLLQRPESTHGFDLMSAILSHSSLQGNLPTSLAEIKAMLSPETIQKMLNARGLSLPSLESLRGRTPAQIRKILTRLKPLQGRIDPHILDILANTFSRLSPSLPEKIQSPNVQNFEEILNGQSYNSMRNPEDFHKSVQTFEDELRNSNFMKRNGLINDPDAGLSDNIEHNQNNFTKIENFSNEEVGEDEENIIKRTTRHPHGNFRVEDNNRVTYFTPPTKFSSKFRRKFGTSSMSAFEPLYFTTPLIESSTEAPPPFNHITDPNIRNHRLYGWMYQNFTQIDRGEDLMMDESSSIPTRVVDALENTENQNTENDHTDEDDFDNKKSENLENSNNESNGNSSTESEENLHFTREPLKKSTANELLLHQHDKDIKPNFFHPSPTDPHMAQGSQINSIQNNRPNNNLYNKQDRILAHQQPGNFPKPLYRPGGVPTHFTHPFAHYREKNTNYAPSHYHINKYHYFNPNEEQDLFQSSSHSAQSSADDKNDVTSWTSSFFLLGGLVAVSALVAFVLPSFLTTVTTTAGKENENSDSDFWKEVKGLYTDLTHIAKGDFSYFNNNSLDGDANKNEEEVESKENVKNKSLELEGIDYGSEEDLATTTSYEIIKRGKGRVSFNETKASDAHPLHPAVLYSFRNNSAMYSNNNNNSNRVNNTFLREWAKVQLQILDA